MQATGRGPLIHIGFYKTASSWMQQHLFTPESGFAVGLDPVAVQLTLIEPGPFRFNPGQALEIYRGRVAAGDPEATAVVTAEALSGALLQGGRDARQNADRLRATFPKAKILLVTREQKTLIRSLYKSMVAWGTSLTIRRLLAPADYPQAGVFHLDFLRFDLLAAHYMRLFGRDNVLVLPYEMFQRTPREFLQRIYAHCEMDAEFLSNRTLPFGRKVNRTVSLSAIAYQRWLNRVAVAWSGQRVSRFGNEEQVQRVNRRMRRFPAVPYLDDWLEARFAAAVANATAGQFAASNQRLQAMMGLSLAHYGYEMPGS